MYRLYQFGPVALPLADAKFQMGSAPSRQSASGTSDGAFDVYGDDRAPAQYPYPLPWSAEVIESNLAAMRTALHGLAGLRGKRYKLYRQAFADRTFQWAWARVGTVPAEHGVRNAYHQPVQVIFEVWSPWYTSHHGAGWFLNDGEYLNTGLYLNETGAQALDSSPESITLTNAGTADVNTVTVTVTAGDADITALTVATPLCEWTYSGVIVTGTSLVVDCGAQSVLNAGADAWADFDVTANHASRYWLVIPASGTTATVTFTGGGTGATITFDYWEGYE